MAHSERSSSDQGMRRISTERTGKAKSGFRLSDGPMGFQGTINRMSQRIRSDKGEMVTVLEGKSSSFRIAYQVLHSNLFTLTFTVLIVLTLALVIIETDANARDEDSPLWINALGWAILVSFVFEIGLRLVVKGRSFWLDGMNVAEFIVVAVDLILNLISALIGPGSLSFLRAVRLIKLARALKVLRAFPELRLLVAGLRGCMSAIFWGSVLLGFMLLMWAIIAVQLINPLNEQLAEEGEYGGCDRCPIAFSSVFNASLTIFQHLVAGDSWGTPTIAIIENYPASGLFFASVFVTVGLAALNLILGVVVDVASEARDGLMNEMHDEKILSLMEAKTSLLKLFVTLDEDGNGVISRKELEHAFDSHLFEQCASTLGITVEDLNLLWGVLDADRSGAVSYEKFVTTLYKMKTSSTEYMLASVKFYVTEIRHILEDKISTTTKEVIDKDKEYADQIIGQERRIVDQIEAVKSFREEFCSEEALTSPFAGKFDTVPAPEENSSKANALLPEEEATHVGDVQGQMEDPRIEVLIRGGQFVDEIDAAIQQLVKDIFLGATVRVAEDNSPKENALLAMSEIVKANGKQKATCPHQHSTILVQASLKPQADQSGRSVRIQDHVPEEHPCKAVIIL